MLPACSASDSAFLPKLFQGLLESQNGVGWRGETELTALFQIVVLVKQIKTQGPTVAFALSKGRLPANRDKKIYTFFSTDLPLNCVFLYTNASLTELCTDLL